MLRIAAVFSLGAAMALGAAIAYAQGPGSSARFAGRQGGPLMVDTSFVAADGCQTILSARGGTPPGQSVPRDTVPATVVIGPDPAGCSGKRVVRRLFTVSGSQFHNLVQIFFVSRDGRILKIEKVSIENG